MRDALTVMYVLALRISELCQLKPSDVDFERQTVRILGKGSKVRHLPITPDINDILKAAVKRPGYCFNVKVATFRNYVKLAATRAKVGHVHPHMIRHSRATHLMNDGLGLADIKAIMRHDAYTSTLVYTHVALDRMRRLMS
jgi:integrase